MTSSVADETTSFTTIHEKPIQKDPSSQMTEEDIPQPAETEFTLRAILAVIGGVLALFNTVGITNAFGIFQDYYHRVLIPSKSDFDIAWIGSVQMFLMFVSAVPAGLLADKFGPTILLVTGSAGTLLALFMISLCTQYYQFFLAQSVLLGISMGFVTIPATATCMKYFNKHRGVSTGIIISGSSLGGIIWPIMCNKLLNSRGVSFGWTMRAVAFVALPLLILTVLLVRPPPAPLSTSKDSEKTGNYSAQKTPPAKPKVNWSFTKNPTFLIFIVGAAIYNLGMFSPFFFTTPYSVSLGISPDFSFYLTSFLSAGSLFGRILIGYLADRYGTFNLTSVSAFTGGIICFTWTTATTKAGLTVWALAYGFISGAVLSLQLQCASSLATKESIGMAMGTSMAAMSLTGLVGSPIAGELVKHGYLALSMYVAATLMLGGLLFVGARLRQSNKLWAKV